jgi:hypothetical protein
MQLNYAVSPARAVAGLLAYSDSKNEVATGINSEASATIPPGIFVRRVAGSERQVLLPSAAAHVTAGLAGGFAVFASLNINPNVVTNVDRSHFQPKQEFGYLRHGTIWVPCSSAWTEGGQVFVRFLARAGFTQLGQVHASVDSFDPGGGAVDHCAALVHARFLNTGGAAGLALIRVVVTPTVA